LHIPMHIYSTCVYFVNKDRSFDGRKLSLSFSSICLGQIGGDPHFTTLDGLDYTFNGVGEFILLKDTNNTFMAQVRMEQLKDDNGNIFGIQEFYVTFCFREAFAFKSSIRVASLYFINWLSLDFQPSCVVNKYIFYFISIFIIDNRVIKTISSFRTR